MSNRRMMMAYLLAKRRGEEKARRDMDEIADRFEAVNEATLAKIRSLRSELARMHAIDDFIAAERDETRWLH